MVAFFIAARSKGKTARPNLFILKKLPAFKIANATPNPVPTYFLSNTRGIHGHKTAAYEE